MFNKVLLACMGGLKLGDALCRLKVTIGQNGSMLGYENFDGLNKFGSLEIVDRNVSLPSDFEVKRFYVAGGSIVYFSTNKFLGSQIAIVNESTGVTTQLATGNTSGTIAYSSFDDRLFRGAVAGEVLLFTVHEV